MSFTKDKWVIIEKNRVAPLAMDKNDSYVIADCYGPDSEGNSKLISAAPDLLEALEKARPFVEALVADDIFAGKVILEIDAAIKKARGE